jgi:hypothetical protein
MDVVLVWLSAVEGAKPRYAPDGSRLRIHCFAGLQSAKDADIDCLIVGRWITSVGSRHVGTVSGDSASTSNVSAPELLRDWK